MIGTARKVVSYEICAYESVQGLAAVLGQQNASDFLEEAIEEINVVGEELTDLSEAIVSGEDVDQAVGELDEEDLGDEELEEEDLIEEGSLEEPAEGEHRKSSAS